MFPNLSEPLYRRCSQKRAMWVTRRKRLYRGGFFSGARLGTNKAGFCDFSFLHHVDVKLTLHHVCGSVSVGASFCSSVCSVCTPCPGLWVRDSRCQSWCPVSFTTSLGGVKRVSARPVWSSRSNEKHVRGPAHLVESGKSLGSATVRFYRKAQETLRRRVVEHAQQ